MHPFDKVPVGNRSKEHAADHASSLHFRSPWLPRENAEQGCLYNHTWGSWGYEVLLLRGVLGQTYVAELPQQAVSSCAEVTQLHGDWPLIPSHNGTAECRGTSWKVMHGHHSMHNTWIFAAKWALIMYWTKALNAGAAWAKQMPKKWKICPNLWLNTQLLFMWYCQLSLIEDLKYLGRDYRNIQRYNICILNVNLTQRSVHEGMFIISTPINSQMTPVFYKLVRNKSLP